MMNGQRHIHFSPTTGMVYLDDVICSQSAIHSYTLSFVATGEPEEHAVSAFERALPALWVRALVDISPNHIVLHQLVVSLKEAPGAPSLLYRHFLVPPPALGGCRLLSETPSLGESAITLFVSHHALLAHAHLPSLPQIPLLLAYLAMVPLHCMHSLSESPDK